jgi:hypothetical protein
MRKSTRTYGRHGVTENRAVNGLVYPRGLEAEVGGRRGSHCCGAVPIVKESSRVHVKKTAFLEESSPVPRNRTAFLLPVTAGIQKWLPRLREAGARLRHTGHGNRRQRQRG